MVPATDTVQHALDALQARGLLAVVLGDLTGHGSAVSLGLDVLLALVFRPAHASVPLLNPASRPSMGADYR